MCPLSAEGSSHAPPTVWASFREFAEAERKSRRKNRRFCGAGSLTTARSAGSCRVLKWRSSACELQKVRAELDRSYREIKARLGQQDQETLLHLADLENELREETSLTSFIAGFQLGMGIAGEIEPYCFEDEEEKQAIERAKARYLHIKN